MHHVLRRRRDAVRDVPELRGSRTACYNGTAVKARRRRHAAARRHGLCRARRQGDAGAEVLPHGPWLRQGALLGGPPPAYSGSAHGVLGICSAGPLPVLDAQAVVTLHWLASNSPLECCSSVEGPCCNGELPQQLENIGGSRVVQTRLQGGRLMGTTFPAISSCNMQYLCGPAFSLKPVCVKGSSCR